MRSILVIALLALLALAGVAPATASTERHVHGGFRNLEANFYKEDGCLTRGANVSTRSWDVTDGGTTTHLSQTRVFVATWDNCLNESVFWAVGQFANVDFDLSNNLATARLRVQGELTASYGRQVPVNIDLQFSSDTRQLIGTDGSSSCWNGDYTCNRLLRARRGHSEGTVVVNGTEFFTPWWGQTEGITENGASTMDATVSCVLPDGVDVHECNLLELP